MAAHNATGPSDGDTAEAYRGGAGRRATYGTGFRGFPKEPGKGGGGVPASRLENRSGCEGEFWLEGSSCQPGSHTRLNQAQSSPQPSKKKTPVLAGLGFFSAKIL